MNTAAQQLEVDFMRVFAAIEETRGRASEHADQLPIWFYSISADIGLRSITQVRQGFIEESQIRRAQAVANPCEIYADIADTFDQRDPQFLAVLNTCLATSLIDLALTTATWKRNYQENTAGLHFLAWDWKPEGPGKIMSFRCLASPNAAEFDGRFLYFLTTKLAEMELAKDRSKSPAFIR